MSISSHDDFSKIPVANFSFRPWWYLLIIEMGVMISIPIFLIGGQLGLGLTLSDLILSTLIGGLILGIIGGLTARLGTITRCSTALIARITFGKVGALFIALLLAMGMTGWWGVQTELFADAVVQLADQLFHIDVPREIMIILGGSAMIVTAALGIRAIGRLSYIAVPMLTLGLIYGLFSLIKAGSLDSILAYHPPINTAITLGTATAIVTGGFIVGASCNPDYARFAINKRHGFGYAFADYALVYPLLLVVSGVIAIAFQTKNILIHLVPPGFSWLVFVMMMFATWSANDCNLYSSSLNLATALPKIQRSHLAVIAGILGILLAEFHVAEHLISFLTFLGILISPISGVFIVNAIGRTNAVATEELAQVPNWHFSHLIAWFCGALLGYLTTPANALGLGLLQLTSVPALDAAIGAGLIMLAIKIVHKERVIASDPQTNSLIAPNYAGVVNDTE